MADLVGDRSTAPPIAKSHVIACLLNLMHSSDDRKNALVDIPGLLLSVIAQLEGEVLLARRYGRCELYVRERERERVCVCVCLLRARA